eukprot:EG_transcript_4930
MKVSVYAIYVIACLLACGAAVLTGVVLSDTFNKQQQASETAQLRTGVGQVSAMRAVIQNQMDRIVTACDANARAFLYKNADAPPDVYQPNNVIAAFNRSLFANWVPAIKAPDQLNGFGLSFVYPNETAGAIDYRSVQVYWDLLRTGEYAFTFASSSSDDGLVIARRVNWENESRPVLAEELYPYDITTFLSSTYLKDNYFGAAQPWVTSDCNSYWYFMQLRAFRQHGACLQFETWDTGAAWLERMRKILTPNANMIAFDSRKYVMAATTLDEVRRLDNCSAAVAASGVPSTDCITSPADQHPTPEIRNVFLALHDPLWDDPNAGMVDVKMAKFSLKGAQYMGISGTLFSKDNFRTTIVWYQPWVVLQSNTTGLTVLICVLTVLSTFVLTLLGVFAVLRPLAALGKAMRVVALTLKEGHGGREAVLEPRTPSVFHEVEAIGKDFETIVVDFLGFSSAKTRDNAHAPKDPDKPFAVLFTDIQSSTELWGKNPAEMSRCLQIHHRLIRRLIDKHRLYEVKTVGDAFMVTTTCALAALRFALDLQLTFHDHYWDWDGADEFYQEADLAFDRSVVGPSLDTGGDDLWNGLRVRIGAHYGTGKVTYDEVSKGYDYYGPVVNTAARIEAVTHGGQVVVSEALLKALPFPLDPTLGVLVPLGTVPLRGVAEPPALVEVKPLALQGRRFPPLRLDEAKDGELPLETPSLSPSHSPWFPPQTHPWLGDC